MVPKKRDEERVSSVQRLLEREACDALVCCEPRHVLMLSGYWPMSGSAWAIATREGRVELVVPEDELELASASWADAVYTFRPTSLDCLDGVTVAVREPLARALATTDAETIGYEHVASLEPSTEASHFSYGEVGHEIIRAAAPRAALVRADAWLEHLRLRKTRAELDGIRAVCRLAGVAYGAGVRAIVAGVTERMIAAAFEAAFEAAAPTDARARAFFHCMSGPNASEAHRAYHRSRSRRIEPGDVVLVHSSSTLDGYWTDLTRTYVLGKTDGVSRRLEAVAAAREAALARVMPGVEARAVDAAARDVVDAWGFGPEFRGATGHGVGYAAEDREERPRLHPRSSDVLEIGMTCNVEPGLFRRGVYGVCHSDMIAVGPDRCEVLSPF